MWDRSRRRAHRLLVVTILCLGLQGCTGFPASMPDPVAPGPERVTMESGASLYVLPTLIASPSTQAIVNQKTQADIRRLEIIPLREVGTNVFAPIARQSGGTSTLDDPNIVKVVQTYPTLSFDKPVVLENLKSNQKYRIIARAFDAQGSVISSDDAFSSVDVTVGIDETVSLPTKLPVKVIPTLFSAQASVSCSVTGSPAFAYMDVALYSRANSIDYPISTATQRYAAAQLPRTARLTNLRPNTTYRLKFSARGADDAELAATFMDLAITTETRPPEVRANVHVPFQFGVLAGNGQPPDASAFDFRGDGVAVDASGNIYYADGIYSVIRKITPLGEPSVVAGNGTSGFSGDGGLATNAQLSYPKGLAVDSTGALYIADYGNNRIRKVSPSGIMTTVSGNGVLTYSGDGGAATSAALNAPEGVAVWNGVLYIADTGNHRIRKVSSGVISTHAGTGTSGYAGDGGQAAAAKLNSPRRICFDAAGNLYINDSFNYRIRKVTTSGIVSTIAGNGTEGYSGDNGPATSAQLYVPGGIACDAQGNLFVADYGNCRIRRVSTAGTIATVAGNGTKSYAKTGDGGPATNAVLGYPTDIAAAPNGTLFIAGLYRNCKVDAAGILNSMPAALVNGDGAQAADARLAYPYGVALDPAGNVLIGEGTRVRSVATSGRITTIAGSGFAGASGDGDYARFAQFAGIRGLAVDGAGNLFVSNFNSHLVRKISATGIVSTVAGNGVGGFAGDGGPAKDAQLRQPVGLALDAAGNLYIADSGNHRVRKVTPAGIISTVAGDGVNTFKGDGGSATSASLNTPYDVAVGPDQTVFIADTVNIRVRSVRPDGVIRTIAGGGVNLGAAANGKAATTANMVPWALTVDQRGHLFVLDSFAKVVSQVTPNGTIQVVMDSSNASLSSAADLAVDAAGRLYVVDAATSKVLSGL